MSPRPKQHLHRSTALARLVVQPQGSSMDPAGDPFNLQRFVAPQDAVMADVLAELQQGRKRSHWMWFVFPQLAALGRSATAKRFGLRSLDEARAYLTHPVLGERLRQCCGLLMRLGEVSATEVLGTPDDAKLQSCLTLFHLAAPRDPLFTAALAKYFGGRQDAATRQLCASPQP